MSYAYGITGNSHSSNAYGITDNSLSPNRSMSNVDFTFAKVKTDNTVVLGIIPGDPI